MEPPANIFSQSGYVRSGDRRQVFGHGSATVWFTGLSGSGKSTIAYATEQALMARAIAAYVLDGDNIRHGLNRDLAFSPTDREENIRRIGEVSRLFSDAGLIVLTAFISPYQEDRNRVRQLHSDCSFLEVFVNTPLEVCEQRDVKGLYAKARAGEIPDFSGISAPYEPPQRPELVLDTRKHDVDSCVARVLERLVEAGVIETESS